MATTKLKHVSHVPQSALPVFHLRNAPPVPMVLIPILVNACHNNSAQPQGALSVLQNVSIASKGSVWTAIMAHIYHKETVLGNAPRVPMLTL